MSRLLTSIDDMRVVLREEDIPFFSQEQLQFYVDMTGSYEEALYECLMVKAENTSLMIPGMTTGDTSSYFRRMARRYRPSNSGILSGG